VDRLTARPPASLTVLAGPSGAGKSSALRAGLLPALRDRGLVVADMFPGEEPELKLDVARREALSEMGRDQVTDTVDVVAVDQFEELFTSTAAHKTDSFIARITNDADPTRWVVTVRADFLGDLLAHPELGRKLQESLVLVPPLEDHEVETAIIEPARRVGVDVEPSLVATILREVQSRASALPLMQYALTDLFDRRRGDVLTLDAYDREGGLSGALVRRADQVLQRLSPQGRDVARQIFLQLVTIADNGEFARRRVRRDSLAASETRLTDQILEQFGAQRLLTFDQDPTSSHATVELAHESLLEVWPRLSRWIDEAREELLMRSTLNTALAEWEASDRDQSFLLSSGRLAQHESWTAETDLALTENEIEFLSESRRNAELARARRRRRRNWITAGFGLAAAVATTFGIVALQQAEAAAETARIAKAEGLAANASNQLEVDPELSLLLALEAVETTRSVDGTVLDVAEEALHRAVLADRLLVKLPHSGQGIAHFSPDGRSFVTSSEDPTIAQIWAVDPAQLRLSLEGHTDSVTDAVFDPAGERVATSSADGTVRVWDVATGESDSVFRVGSAPPKVPVFSNDGSKLAATTAFGTVWVADLNTGEPIWSVSPPPGTTFTTNLEFSPDDSLLLVSRETDETADDFGPLIFDVAAGDLVETPKGHAADVTDVGFTPDGSQILTASLDSTVRIWDAETGENQGTFRGHQGPIIDLQISKDGTTVASSGSVDVKLWDLSTLEVRAEVFGHTGPVDGIDIGRDGSLLLTSSTFDQTTRLWDLTPYWSHELIGLPGPAGQPGGLAYSPDGDQIAAARESGLVTLWDPLNGTELQTFEAGGPVFGMAFDAAGELLAIAGEAGTALHDLRSGDEMVLHTGSADDVVFGPGGLLATVSSGGVHLWEPAIDGDGQLIIPMATTVAFDPDGRGLAAGGPFGVLIRDVDGGFLADLYPPPPSPPPPVIRSLSFHQDRGLLVTAGDDANAVLWSTETFEPLHSLEGHTAELLDAVFHPTRPELATAGSDGTVKFWNVDTGRLRLSIPAPGDVSDLAYSPDGRYLAAIGQGFVTVYILDVAELVSEAQDRLTRWWTETECGQYLDPGTCPPVPEHLSD
jgi:WD40 repeat protein